LSDDLTKHQDASRRKGVVGKSGRNIPAIPKRVETDPPIMSKPLTIGFPGLREGFIFSGIKWFLVYKLKHTLHCLKSF
jgi:hypothetical protein